MSGNAEIMNRRNDEAVRRLQTVLKLKSIVTQLRSVRDNALTLSVADEIAKSELLDGVAMAELSALRMLDDEGEED